MNRGFLDRLMCARGLSLNALKKDHHFSPDTIWSWERGTAAKPATARRLARILGVTVEELVRGLELRLLRRGRALDRKRSVELAAKL